MKHSCHLPAARHRLAPVRAGRWVDLLLILAVALGLEAAPARASGPYAVDDSAITPAARGQIETWVSLGRRGHLFLFVPATTLPALPFVEWSVGLDTGRFDGARANGLTPQAKLQLATEPDSAGEVGLAVSGAVRFSLDDEGATTILFNSIATLAATDQLLLHGNLGYVRDRIGRLSALTWGARAEAALIPERLALHGEIFGTTESKPGFQLGLRPTIRDGAMDLEFIFSRNLGDERESWATLGLAFRF